MEHTSLNVQHTFRFPPASAEEEHFSIGLCMGEATYRFRRSLRHSERAYQFWSARRCN